jgi:predicted ArsR family transcriptional regulator
MGRPEKAYRLTPLAQEFFPSEHTNFTSEILRSLEEVYGPAAPEKILYQIFQNQTVKMQAKISGNSLEERTRSLVALRDQDGYMSEYYFNPDIQRHQIIEYNSPLLVIADRFTILTQLENKLIENLLGTRVQREQERISGLYKCQFTLMD